MYTVLTKFITLKFTVMKKVFIAASLCALMMVAQNSFAQATQEVKAAKKEMKAEKKMIKADKMKTNAATGNGVEVAGVSDPGTRNAKADRKMEKAEKKMMKGQAKEMKGEAKEMKSAAKDVKKDASN